MKVQAKAGKRISGSTKPDTEVVFDGEICSQSSECDASCRTTANGAQHDFRAHVDLQIYPPVSPESAADDNALITLNFDRYIRPEGRCKGNAVLLVRSQRKTLLVNWNDLEPLAAALGRAVANAKLKGFLPSTGASKGTPRTAA